MNFMSYSDMSQIQILAFGPKAIVINWPAIISKDINAHINKVNQCIHQQFEDLIIESVCTYSSITIYFNITIEPIVINEINEHLKNEKINLPDESKHINWNIPVCYDASFGLDIEGVAKVHSLSVNEVIKLHTEPLYYVYFLGFLPGFPYLGELNEKLYTPRLKTPRLHTPKGSVAIGDKQTGIYPSNSPGGWNIIGRSPINIFNQLESQPALFSQGDSLKFHAIDLKSYESLLKRIDKGDFSKEELMIQVKE